MQSDDSVFERKPVFDWNQVPLGTVSTTNRNPKTRDTRGLVLRLTPEARTELGTSEETLELPASFVFGMRRDGLTLDRSLEELKAELPRSILKK